MSNDTIFNAERALYLTLLERLPQRPLINDWLAALPGWLADVKDKKRYAHAPTYLSAVERLPEIAVNSVDLNANTLTVHADLTESQNKQITALMRKLMPWRKGPFQIGSGEHAVFIDTEWHSDWKWQRIAPHLGTLEGRHVLDVGGGSGYHGWRMAGAGAEQVIIVDPSCLFYHQFMAIRHFVSAADAHRTHYIPVGLEALPYSNELNSQLFDTVFCMGVLYHRPSPFEHLQQLKSQLIKGGKLVLETLVVEGDANTVLVPHNRYAQMNNVYFLPSVAALTGWLEKVGFTDVRCVDVDITSTEEQRATEWMTYQSLADFLDPNDASKTVEGYSAPMRATLIATKA